MLTSINDIPKSYLELFLNNRSFVRSAGEMTALAIWCLENIKNPSLKLDLEQFQELYSTWNNLKELEERFFANRSQLADLLKEAWLNLHQPYQPLWSCLQKYQNEFFIVTQKNKQAVIDICAYFNLVIDSGNIYSGDNHKNKIDNFIILDKAHIDSSFLFIDDNLRNLIESHKDLGYYIFGLGASTKGNVLLQYCNLGELIEEIGEINPKKFGKVTPGTNIPIVDQDKFLGLSNSNSSKQLGIVIPWHFRNSIKNSAEHYLSKGGSLLVPLPFPEII